MGNNLKKVVPQKTDNIMGQKRYKNQYQKKRYWVNWYCNGFCYKSTSDVDWKGVCFFKKLAKRLGETIDYEEM